MICVVVVEHDTVFEADLQDVGYLEVQDWRPAAGGLAQVLGGPEEGQGGPGLADGEEPRRHVRGHLALAVAEPERLREADEALGVEVSGAGRGALDLNFGLSAERDGAIGILDFVLSSPLSCRSCPLRAAREFYIRLSPLRHLPRLA